MPTEPEQEVEGAQESDDDVAEHAAVEDEAPTDETAADKEEAQ